MSDSKIPLGISACLLGDLVRFDGGHKKDAFLVDVLGDYVDWVKICPEIEIGLGAPRESIRLERRGDDVRLVGVRSATEHTEKMLAFSKTKADEIAWRRLRGYVLKKDSPTCGMERVRLYDENGVPSKDGVGLFARTLMERNPLLPIEEEGRLRDPRLRENFITRIFCYDRWLRLKEKDPKPRDIVAFHTAHKLLLLAHSPEHYRSLGKLVAEAGTLPMDGLLARYEEGLLLGLRRVASPGRHTNVLEHLSGFLKEELDAGAKSELHGVIRDYRSGYVPLITPLVLLNHHLNRLGHAWVEAQTYLEPYPRELALRSAI
jgi:uncharacterized protein YbgA (DUF1722 family)/uncharacterized protein YbbK (DUF523 family)